MTPSPEKRARKLYREILWVVSEGECVPILAAAIREAVEEEREACAKIADMIAERDRGTDLEGVSEGIADEIRARK